MTLESGAILNDRFEIIDEIGHGGFSTVYHARDRKFDNDVAIKEYNPQFAERFGTPDEMRKRFGQEAHLTRKLKHSHIIEIYDWFTANDTLYIVMPYLPDNLTARLEHMSKPEAIRVMKQICKGLAHAHTFRGASDEDTVVHCDVKPGNILFEHNEVKIADFGIAHVPSGIVVESIYTTSFGAGTVSYMPPEQLDGKRDDPRIDVYALGALFYRMLTQGCYYLDFSDELGGNYPWAKDVVRINEDRPLITHLKNENVPQPLIHIIFKALSKEPQNRYANAGEMLEAIQGIDKRVIELIERQSMPVSPPPEPIMIPDEPSGKARRVSKEQAGVLVALIAALCAWTVLWGYAAGGGPAGFLSWTKTPTPTPTTAPTLTSLPTPTPTPTTGVPPTPTTNATPTPTLTPTGTPTPMPVHTPMPASPTSWLCVPSHPSGWQPYIVQLGDTLYSLARRHGTTIDQIQSYNCLNRDIYAGQQLYLPALSTPTSTPTFVPTITSSPTPDVPTNTPIMPTDTPMPLTPTDTPTPTNTPIPLTPTDTPTPTNTPEPITPTSTPTPTHTPAPITPTSTPAPTDTLTPTLTNTPMPATLTSTPTNTPPAPALNITKPNH